MSTTFSQNQLHAFKLPALPAISNLILEIHTPCLQVNTGLLQANVKGAVLAAMVYRSIGVIFGDLGTSPMYIFPSTFDHPPEVLDVLGAVSCIFWTLTLLALLKYVLIVLWANDNGEGRDLPVSQQEPQNEENKTS